MTAGEGEEARSILVCVEAIVRCVDFPGLPLAVQISMFLFPKQFLRVKFMPVDSTQNYCCAHRKGVPLHLKRCVPGCMWLQAEGMQSLERGPEHGTKEEEGRAVTRLAD